MEFFQDVLLLRLESSCLRDGKWRLSGRCSHRGMTRREMAVVHKGHSGTGRVSWAHGCDRVDINKDM